jgi:hypothetical protein
MIRLAATAAFGVALAAASPAQARIVPGKGMAGVAVGMAEAGAGPSAPARGWASEAASGACAGG